MAKILTFLSLLRRGAFEQLVRRGRINLRGARLRRAAGRPFRYRLGGVPFVCVPGIPDSEERYLTAETDRDELDLLRAWLEPGDSMVDIGANLGLYSFAAHHHLRGRGIFLAVEASPELARNFTASAALLGLEGLRLEQRAVADTVGEIVFYTAPAGKSTGVQSLHPDPLLAADYVPRVVPVTTLAEIVVRHPHSSAPALVKMDIEGAEAAALRGAPSAWLGPDGPMWMLEVNPTALARSGSSAPELAARFDEVAFERWLYPQYAVNGERTLPPRRLTDDEAFSDAWFYNLVAMPRAAIWAERRRRLAALLPAPAASP